MPKVSGQIQRAGVGRRNDGVHQLRKAPALGPNSVEYYRLLARWYRLRQRGIGPHLIQRAGGLWAFDGPIQEAELRPMPVDELERLVAAAESIVVAIPRKPPKRWKMREVVRRRISR